MLATHPYEYVSSVTGHSKRALQYCAHHDPDERDADTSMSPTHSVDHSPPLREQCMECGVQSHTGRRECGHRWENQLHHLQCRVQPQRFAENARPIALFAAFVTPRNGVTCRESSELLLR